MNPEQTKDQERFLVNQELSKLSTAEVNAWEKCKTMLRTPCYVNRIFVVWSFDAGGNPVVRGGLTIQKIEVYSSVGTRITVSLDTDLRSGTCVIGHTPLNLIDGRLFAYAPFITNLSFYTPTNLGKPKVRVSLCFKQEAGNLDTTQGEIRITPISEFRSKYPKFKGLHL